MKIVLPKECRGYFFERLFTVEMNDFDVERLLPSLFYLAVTRGRQRSARVNDPEAFNLYLNQIADHNRVAGFQSESGRRLLDRWIRASIIQVGKVGQNQQREQIEYILPLTLLSYKAGLPGEIRRQRGVHIFIYWLLLSVLEQDGDGINSSARLDRIFREAFGKGLKIDEPPNYDGSYDGEADLDIHTLLSICYLDGFRATTASKREMPVAFGPALPEAATSIGTHLLQYIIAYQSRLPALSLTRGLMSLINFELFIYTLKLAYAINRLAQNRELPESMLSGSNRTDLELYVDFTRNRGGTSDNIARSCVERDLEELRAFHESSLFLRTLDRFAQQQTHLKEELKDLSTPQYLYRLIQLIADPDINADARAEIRAIKQETLSSCNNEVEKREATELFSELERQIRNNPLALNIRLLSEAQKKNAMESIISWYWSTGGLRKQYGIVVGNLQGRRNWRYAMSDDLLATLVQLALIDNSSGNIKDSHVKPRIRMSEFLHYLESTFGILLERPPSFMDSTIARRASRENLEYLRRRLRQMGFYQALSDDFTAQYLRDPLQEGKSL